MACLTLISIDFIHRTNEQLDDFFEALEKSLWEKPKTPAEAWKVHFQYQADYNKAKEELLDDILVAKIKSRIDRVNFAMLFWNGEIIKDSI